MDFHQLRKEYRLSSLRRKDLDFSPFSQFRKWWDEAISHKLIEPNAMLLATATNEGIPSCRTVLMKEFSEKGILFFTNLHSRKGQELKENPHAALTFLWKEMERQIRIEGVVERASLEEVRTYFYSRPRKSQLSAFVSSQSQVILSRDYLEDKVQEAEELYQGKEIPLPEHWGGFRVVPSHFEFWQGREDRLHDRFVYTLLEDGSWKIDRLAP